MTQIVSFDMSAVSAPRQDVSFQPPARNESDFNHAYQQADNQNRSPQGSSSNEQAGQSAERSRPAVSANATAERPSIDQTGAHASQRSKPSESKASKSNDATSSDNQATRNTQAQTAAKPIQAQAPTKDAQAQPSKDAAQAPAPSPQSAANQVADQAAAQALLALMLATAQVKPAVPQAPVAAAQATEPVSTAKSGATAAQAQTAQLAAQAQLNAQAQAAPSQAPASAPTAPKAQLPAAVSAIGQAAQSLGLTKVQVANTFLQGGATAAELSKLALKGLEKKADTQGSITPETIALDGASGTGTPSQAVNLLSDQKANDQGSTDKHTATPDASGLMGALSQGDKAVAEASKVLADQAAPKAQDVMPQILKYAEQLKANQQSAITLQLNPEHLGSMEIKVTSHLGVVSAQLTADNQNVKALLESQVANLQQSFMDLGLKVDKVQVMLSSANLGFDMAGSMAQQQQGNMGNSSQQPRSGFASGNGYGQWLGEDGGTEQAYAPLASLSAINTMA